MNAHKTLSAHKLKSTEARVALLEDLKTHDKPVDAQHLIEHLQKTLDVDRVTVFRMLNILTEHGILRKVELGEGKARYELASTDHHHLICENCGEIEDVSDCNLIGLEEEIQMKKHFLIKRHSLEFFGLCNNCQQ